MKRVIFLFTKDLVERLRKASYHKRESMSAIVRKAVEAYLKKLGY